MASLFEAKDRLVIPNWRNFDVTSKLGELEPSKTKPNIPTSTELNIEDYLNSWKELKSIYTAGDLLSASFVNKIKNHDQIKEAALFILKNDNISSELLIRLAKNTLDLETSPFKTNNINVGMEVNEINRLIKVSKQKLNNAAFNPVTYVELARLYSILGIKEKALRNMKIAITLSPDNRFILRAASRLYAHFHEIDKIYGIIKKSPLVKIDPWIMSAEISLAMAAGITPLFVKNGQKIIDSGSFSLNSLTELASSIATLELQSGALKKAKKLFRFALKAPNDNSLAQVKWAVNKHFLFPIDPRNFCVRNKFEALALDNYYKGEWKTALHNCHNWFADLPFSKGPVLLGAFISQNYLNEEEEARNLYTLGLISHPNDALLINNIVYSLALENKLDNAEERLRKAYITDETSESTKICLIATKGLIAFRKGEIDKGRKLYYHAIDQTHSIQNHKLYWTAILNLCREEMLINSTYVHDLMNIIGKIPDNTDAPEIKKLKIEIIEYYQKNFQI